jgi:adhesin/invasin
MKPYGKLLLSLVLAQPLAGCSDDAESCDETVPGNICTIIGSGESGYDGDEDITALDARMSLPQDTLTTSDGTIYILDWNNHRIRKVARPPSAGARVMEHVAGRGELGGTLDDPANSDFNHPTGLTFDPSGGRLVIAAWHNSKVRSIDLATGEISDLCGDGRRAYFGDGLSGAMVSLDLPASVIYDAAGNLLVMDQANQVIRSIDPSGVISRFAGRCIVDRAPPTGPGPCAEGVAPVACPAPSGKTTCGDPMMTCGQPCNPGYLGDDGLAIDMRMGQPFGQSADPAGRMAFDASGNLYFADTSNAMIRMIDAAGVVRRVAGQPPSGGMPVTGYAGDGGQAIDATLYNPVDLAFGPDGTLYFTDVYNHCVRAINPGGDIRTVAGVCGQSGYDGDGGPANQAKLKRPYGLEYVNGTLLITDTGNNVIRQVRL